MTGPQNDSGMLEQTLIQPAPSASSKPSAIRRWLIAALIGIVALVAVFAGFEYAASTRSALAGVCGALSFTRHGLPCDIPLPSDAAFHSTSTGTLPEGYPVTGWDFSTFQTPDQIQRLYLQELRADGWPCAVAKTFAGTLLVVGIHKPDRPNTFLEVTLDPDGVGEYTISIALIQANENLAPLPANFTCP